MYFEYYDHEGLLLKSLLFPAQTAAHEKHISFFFTFDVLWLQQRFSVSNLIINCDCSCTSTFQMFQIRKQRLRYDVAAIEFIDMKYTVYVQIDMRERR